MSWAGDWMCRACQHMNFKKRDLCQRCGMSKFGGQVDVSNTNTNTNTSASRSEVLLAGDWYCQAPECGAHNYASRTSCYRCGSHKGEFASSSLNYSQSGNNNNNDMYSSCYASEASLPGWKSGDWICSRPECGVHNYACRIECFKCKAPRNFGEKF